MSGRLSDQELQAVLADLPDQPLSRVCARLGLDAERALETLLGAGRPGSLEGQLWWPELVRVAGRQGIRRAARLFRTNPRRVRRALARQGIRVSGTALELGRLPISDELRRRLGNEPDHQLGRQAGLTPQAIAGIRRRLGIAAFRPAPTPRRRPGARDDARSREAVARAPIPAVVDAALPSGAPAPTPTEPPLRRRVRVEAVVPRADAAATQARPPGEAAIPADPRVRIWARPALNPAPGSIPPAVTPATLDASARERILRPVVPEEEESATLAAARAARRSGRVRIVRPEVVELRAPEPEPPRKAERRRAEPRHGQVREIAPVLAAFPPPPPPAKPSLGTPPRSNTPSAGGPSAPSTSAPVAPGAAPDIPSPSAPSSTVKERAGSSRPSAAAPPAAQDPTAPPAAAALPTPPAAPDSPTPPAAPDPAAPPAAASTVPRAPAPSATLVVEPAVRPAPPPSPTVASLAYGWEFRVDDRALPFLVIAPDIEQATRLIAARLGAEAIRRASARRLGPVLLSA